MGIEHALPYHVTLKGKVGTAYARSARFERRHRLLDDCWCLASSVARTARDVARRSAARRAADEATG